MVSDSDLVDRLRDILRTSDLNTTTAGTVRRKLEEDFAVDLSDRKAFVRDQIDLFLQNHVAKAEENEQMIKPEEDNNERESQNDDAEEEDEEEEEESNEVDKEVKKRGGGFTKICSLSPQLQKFVGMPELARTEVVKKLWAYIRENNLQNPKDKRNIICDETLRALFRVDSINMFQMNKALSKHIWPLNVEYAAPVKSSQKEKEKQRKQGREEGPDEPKRKEKRQKGGSSGFLAPIPLSDALVKFFGSGENALSRSDVVKRMWEYIKQNNLQDPSDKRRIICDDKLKELFDVDSFNGFTVSKLLTAHFIKTEH